MAKGPAGLLLDDAEADVHAKGTVHIWMRRPVLVIRATGTLTVQATRTIERATVRLVQPGGRYLSFHDWEEVEDYESEGRRILMEASARNRAHIDRTHVLLRSRLIVAALDAARIFLKHIVPYSSRALFEAELRKALQGPSREGARPPPAR